MNISAIYMIRSKIKPERVYIGSSFVAKKRRFEHFTALKRGKHHSIKLQNHYNKYGRADLIFTILLICVKDDLIKHEQMFLDSLDPFFNICKWAYSCKGRVLSKETRDKISESHKGIRPNKETREKLRVSHLGQSRKQSEEHKRKLSESNRGQKRSLEAKIKMSLAHKGKPTWNKGIKTGQVPWNKGKNGLQVNPRKGKKKVNGKYIFVDAT